MKIVLGSARMPAGVESIAKELGLECIMICDAGAYILKGEECIASRHLSAASMREVYEEYAERYGLNMWIFRTATGISPGWTTISRGRSRSSGMIRRQLMQKRLRTAGRRSRPDRANCFFGGAGTDPSDPGRDPGKIKPGDLAGY